MLEAHLGLDVGRGNLGRGQDLLGKCPEVRAKLAVVRRQFKQAPSFRSYCSHQPVRHRSRLSIKKVPGFLSIQVTVLIRPQPQRTGLTRISLQRILCQHSVKERRVASQGLKDEIKKRNPFDSAEQEAALNLRGRTIACNPRLPSSSSSTESPGPSTTSCGFCAGQGSRCLARKLPAG